MKRINYCKGCNNYTLEDKCPSCSQNVLPNVPPKFSIEDKVGKYRRIARKQELQEKGLL